MKTRLREENPPEILEDDIPETPRETFLVFKSGSFPALSITHRTSSLQIAEYTLEESQLQSVLDISAFLPRGLTNLNTKVVTLVLEVARDDSQNDNMVSIFPYRHQHDDADKRPLGLKLLPESQDAPAQESALSKLPVSVLRGAGQIKLSSETRAVIKKDQGRNSTVKLTSSSRAVKRLTQGYIVDVDEEASPISVSCYDGIYIPLIYVTS